MTDNNETNNNTVAPLANVALCLSTLERAVDRSLHLPGMVCMYGPAGYGKSTAASFAANELDAYYVECKSTWTKKAVLKAILKEMGRPESGPVYELTDRICEQLVLSNRPLIVDQLDHLVKRKDIECIRDLHDGSGAAILLIGEENLPSDLERWECFHSRVIEWIPAQPADINDCRHLANLYCKDVTIADDLLKKVCKSAKGSIRRICGNIEQIRTEAKNIGYDEITLEDWGDKPLYTGKAPARRRENA
ncbi:ATP-binding protein [uncultured Desulfuromonas sp.]|uniref:ATP-binding protein n=1 Tax=uncultured Desulfuromonas sp. TaxID=181013 RepID=UPI002AAA9F5B|nr:ATP-binding protein [uncultured Desulfuromonas sp.]